MPIHPAPNILSHKDPFFGLRILQPNEDPSLPPKRILNYKDGSELVYIPPGPFMMGDDQFFMDLEDCLRHEVYLYGCYMAVWPVTNKQYRRFMWETGHRAPDGDWMEEHGGEKVWEGNRLLRGYEEHPVVCVDWGDAAAYGNWANLRLPTEAEWEKAAAGPLNTEYPWGKFWEPGRCTRGVFDTGVPVAENRTVEVRAYPVGVSGYGCQQMSGNVSEWCSDWWYGREEFIGYLERTKRSPLVDPRGPERGTERVRRGGCNWYIVEDAKVWHRDKSPPNTRKGSLGFRLARSFP